MNNLKEQKQIFVLCGFFHKFHAETAEFFMITNLLILLAIKALQSHIGFDLKVKGEAFFFRY
jgi:hypothetical protein